MEYLTYTDEMTHPPSSEDDGKTITEKTPMSLGLMVGIIVLVFTIIGGSITFGIGIWQGGRWIGEFTTKLDTIMLDLKIVKDSNSELRLKWDNHESRILKIETAGSPQLQRLIDQVSGVQRTVDKLSSDMENHVKLTGKP